MKPILIILFLNFKMISFAQITDSIIYELPPVNLSTFHINNSLLNVPAAISIINEQTINSNNLTEIAPVLNKVAGVFMQSGSINTNRISIRGLGARTPYGTNKIRAFYGNIPLTSGDSETTIEDLDLQSIEQIEVIKGPMSSIYGAGLAGAILLHPKENQVKGHEFIFSTLIGSFGLIKNTVKYGWRGNHSSVNFGYHRLESEGFRQNSNYFREGYTLNGDIYKDEKNQLSYLFNHTYLKAFIASSITKDEFENHPENAASNWLDSKGFEQYHSWLGGLDYKRKINPDLNYSTTVYFNLKDANEPRPFDILKQQTKSFGGRIQLSGNEIFKLPVSFVIGGEVFNDNYEGNTFENLYEQNNGQGSLQGNQLTATSQDRFFYNLFAQFRIKFLNKWELQAGLNFNHTQFELTNSFPTESHSSDTYKYDPILAPQLSLLFHPNSNQTLYLSAIRGYSMPSIEEMLNEEGRVNAEIKPENGYNFELGYKIFSADRRFNVDFSAYRMIVEDLLVSERVAEDQYVGINAGKTLHQGLELFAQYRIPVIQNKWILTPYFSGNLGNYEFKEFIYNENDYSGNKLTGVPSGQLTTGIVLQMPYGLKWMLDYYFVEKFPMNDANSVYNDSYQLLNTKINWQYAIWDNANFGVSFGVNNLTNSHYASQVLVNAVGFGNAQPRYYYPGNPVNFYGQLNLNIRL